MADSRLRKYYYYRSSSGFDLNALIYHFLLFDEDFGYLYDFSRGAVVIILTCIITLILCSKISTKLINRNQNVFRILQEDSQKKIPRKESIVTVRPAYNCIQKHLRQTDIFQENAMKLLRKDRLQVEITNSRLSCINRILTPEAQYEWRRSRSPKAYYRPINPEPATK